MREQRRLAAVLAADVVGYSRLMGRDEVGTLARLKEHRAERLEPALARNGGRLVKLTGDGVLAEFGSAVDALRAAIEFQQAVDRANTALPEEQRIVFRVGLHVGDLIVDGDDLYGDGVNIAARLEAEAAPGGIVVSGALHEAAAGKLQTKFIDLGRLSLKNIERQVQAYRVEWGQGQQHAPITTASTGAAAPLPLPDKPSIAVLPFQNMSGDPEQEYFVDGLVEDIITALSHFKSLFVIARNSSFTFKGQAIDIKDVGRKLGVRYVLEGSVRKSGDRVRITGQLIDSQTGTHLWADRFDGDLKDIFDLQDQVTTKVVGIVAPKLDQAEIERAKRKPIESLDAYDCFLRGLATMYEQTRTSFDEAIRFFHRAIELDPEFSTPYGMIARCHSYLWGRGWTADKAHAQAEIRRVAGRVAVLGQDDAAALCPTGFALVRVCKDDETGLALIDQGLAANPNLATGWAQRGAASVFLGQSDAAIEQLTRAMRLNPLDPETYFSEAMMAYACLTQGRYDEALKWAAHSLAHRPNYYVALRMAAIANALSGRIDEARKIMPQIRQLHPESRLSNLKDSVPSRRPEHLAMMVEGLRLAGLPE